MSHTSHRGIVVYCGILLSISAFSIDITLPFFDLMAADFGSSLPSIRSTVTVYIVCLGLGQLLYGPLADRFGRKPALAIGLLFFLFGSVLAMFADSLNVVLAGRVLQGLGGAAAPVVARAILRDLFSGAALARNMAIAVGIFSIGPLVGPLLGAALVSVGGSWRFVFGGMAVYVIGLLLVLIRLPETLPGREPDALSPGILLANGKRVVREPQSRQFLMINAIMLTSMILIVSIMPIIYIREFGVSGTLFALLFAVHALGIILGQFLNHRLIARIGVVSAAIYAAWVTTTAGLLIVFFSLSGWMNPYLLSALVTLFAVGFLCVMSNTVSMILAPHGEIAGFTSSFLGATAQMFAGFAAWLLGWVIAANLLLWGLSLAGISAIVLLMLYRWHLYYEDTVR
ncbi:MAG: MFS transporter [Granulosicoccus sp.]|nr:MFS transporter [Granulosicoccus sp.]